jgi:Zn-dependent protease
MNWWVHSLYESYGIVGLFSWAFWVIFSIVLHELAHGWAAIANGDDTPREMGHMTMNPIVHMGRMSLIVFAILGIAWGLMPINPRRFRHERRGRVLVAAAGPAMNLLLAFITLTAAGTWVWAVTSGRITVATHIAANVKQFLIWGGFINLLLGAFNLLPIPPLDGSAILAGAHPALDRFYNTPAVRMYGMLVVLFFFFGVIEVPLQRTAQTAASTYMILVTDQLIGLDAGSASEGFPEDAEEPDNSAPETMPPGN